MRVFEPRSCSRSKHFLIDRFLIRRVRKYRKEIPSSFPMRERTRRQISCLARRMCKKKWRVNPGGGFWVLLNLRWVSKGEIESLSIYDKNLSFGWGIWVGFRIEHPYPHPNGSDTKGTCFTLAYPWILLLTFESYNPGYSRPWRGETVKSRSWNRRWGSWNWSRVRLWGIDFDWFSNYILTK